MTFVAYVALVLIAGVWDLWRFRIPNVVNAALVVLFVFSYWGARDVISLQNPLLAAGVTFVVAALFFRLHWLGGGDVKLLTATALWAGLDLLLLHIFLTSAFALGLVVLMRFVRPMLLVHAERLPFLTNSAIPQVLMKTNLVPYGAAIAASALVLTYFMPAYHWFH